MFPSTTTDHCSGAIRYDPALLMFLGNINILDHKQIARTACSVLANGLIESVLPAQIVSRGFVRSHPKPLKSRSIQETTFFRESELNRRTRCWTIAHSEKAYFLGVCTRVGCACARATTKIIYTGSASRHPSCLFKDVLLGLSEIRNPTRWDANQREYECGCVLRWRWRAIYLGRRQFGFASRARWTSNLFEEQDMDQGCLR